MRPLLSIVIANYNYGHFLEQAIQSIIAQDMGGKVELIVCDAESTDNSIDIIKKYANGLPPKISYREWAFQQNIKHSDHHTQLITWWCSENDGGQSNAFNKGFSHARGGFLTWLNADDVLLPGVLKKLEKAIKTHPEYKWFAGGCIWLTPEKKVFRCSRVRRICKLRAEKGDVNVYGPSSFFSRQLFEQVGKIDERFHYIMDIDLWLRFVLLAEMTYYPFIKYAWGLRLHPLSKMSGHKFTSGGEILEGKHSKQRFEVDKQKVNQANKEKKWMYEKHGIQPARVSFFQRLISTDFCTAILSRLDTLKYKGRNYLDV